MNLPCNNAASLMETGVQEYCASTMNYPQLQGQPSIRGAFFLNGKIPTLDDIKPNMPWVALKPVNYDPNNPNVTAHHITSEWANFSPEIMTRRNAIRSVTGAKLKRLLQAIFQAPVFANGNEYVIQTIRDGGTPAGYTVYDGSRIHPVIASREYWFEDIASLWAFHFKRTYIEGIERIYAYLQANDSNADLGQENKKAFYVQDTAPLYLDLLAPWAADVAVMLNGAWLAYYFENGLAVGCKAMPSHPRYGHLPIFYSLMRFHNSGVTRWFPTYPEEKDFLFQKECVTSHTEHIFFAPDEFLQRWGRLVPESQRLGNSVILSCPKGISQLAEMELGITTGKAVTICLHDSSQLADKEMLASVISAFTKANVRSLRFMPLWADSYISVEEIIAELGILQQGKTASFVTEPGSKLPGSDVVRKSILFPFIESGQLIWIYGPEKSGKSWLVRNMAHCMSYGKPFLGRYECAPGTKVLYIDSEMLPDKLKQAFKKELVGLGIDEDVRFAVKAAKEPSNPGGEINLLEKEWQSGFNDILTGYDVIVLDCFYSLTGDSPVPRELLKWITPWQSKGKTFIVVDHTNKEGDLQGGLSKKRAADLCIEVTPEDSHYLEVSFPTVRHLGPEDTAPLRLRKVFTPKAVSFEIADGSPTLPSLPDKELRTAVAYALEAKGKSAQEIGTYMGYSGSSVYDWLKKFKDSKQNRPKNSSPESNFLFAEAERLCALGVNELIQMAQDLSKKA